MPISHTSTTVDRYIYVIEHYVSQVPSSSVTLIPEDTCGCWKSPMRSLVNK